MPKKNFYNELQRRNVFRAAITYVAISWVILQAASLIFPIVQVPESAMKILLIVLVVIFPAWIVFAWIYEYTPKGFKKTDELVEAESIAPATSKRLNAIIIGGMALAIMLLLADHIFNVTGSILDTKNDLSIAAMLFDNKGTEEDAYFADGISEDILTQLGKIGMLRVLSRFTLKDYDSKGKTPSQIYHIRGNYPGARKSYSQALEKNPNHYPSTINLANILRSDGDLVATVKMYKRGTELDPLSIVSYVNLSIAYRELGLYEQSLATANTVVQLEPDDRWGYYSLADTYREMGDFEKASKAGIIG